MAVSSLVIFPFAVLSEKETLAEDEFERVTEKFSSFSTIESLFTVIDIVWVSALVPVKS